MVVIRNIDLNLKKTSSDAKNALKYYNSHKKKTS